MKKNTKIVIGVVTGVVLLGILGILAMVMFLMSVFNSYEFTTEELRIEYANPSGYTHYEDENIEFNYPSTWVVGNELTATTEDIIFAKTDETPNTDVVQYQIVTEAEAGISESNYNPMDSNVNKSVKTTPNGVMKLTECRRWLKVNDKKTLMLFQSWGDESIDNKTAYNLDYYTFIGDGNIMYVHISTYDKEILTTIAASLEY